MIIFDATSIKSLVFSPDYDVEMEFSPNQKSLKVIVEAAWLDDGTQLDNGILYFNEWESLSVRKYDSSTDKWSDLGEADADILRYLCEVIFLESSTLLNGFGKKSGHWTEWQIFKGQMHAEFEK